MRILPVIYDVRQKLHTIYYLPGMYVFPVVPGTVCTVSSTETARGLTYYKLPATARTAVTIWLADAGDDVDTSADGRKVAPPLDKTSL